MLDALAHVEKMQTETRNTDSGRRLEVNENILRLTFALEKHIQGLIEAANAMRAGLEETKGEAQTQTSRQRRAVICCALSRSTLRPRPLYRVANRRRIQRQARDLV